MTTPRERQRPGSPRRAEAGEASAHPDLVQSAHGLRNVARALVRDDHIAEDVVQDTLCQALRHDLQPGPLNGWLRRTVENFARQWRRSERRRERRERDARQRANTPSPAELTSRRETLQRVTTALLSLDEPYQTTVFLRYFEDLPPRAIARRTGTNLATVKSRLQRGLAMLRARLDRMTDGDRREWRLALLGTFALDGSATATPLLTTGTLLMGTTTKLLLAAGVLATLGICVYGIGDDPPSPPAKIQAATATADAAAAATLPGTDDTVTQREAVEPAEIGPPWLEHPYELALQVRFIDQLGLPIEHRTIEIVHGRSVVNRSTSPSDARGIATVTLASRTPELEVYLRDPREALRRVTLRHGRTTAITLLVPRRVAALGTFVVTLLDVPARFEDSTFSVHSGSDALLRAGLHPHARFELPTSVERVLEEAVSEVLLATSIARSSTKQMMVAYAPKGPKQEDGAEPLARIVGTVFGPDGKPANKETVALMVDGEAATRVQTDEHGQFELSGLPAGRFELRAGGGRKGLATTTAATTTDTTRADLHLTLGSLVRGQALAADGSPLAGAQVVWEAADGSWIDGAKVAKDGSFVIPNLPGKSGHLSLWLEGHKLPIVVKRDALADAGPIELRAPAARGSLRFDPVYPDATRTAVVARVFCEATGFGAAIGAGKPGEPWELANLPAGWYRVELFHRQLGVVDAGRHWVDADGACDLGRVLLPEPAVLELQLNLRSELKADAIELCRIGRSVDSRFKLQKLVRDNRILLAPGEYAVFWRGADGDLQHERFSVKRGETARVKIAGE
ncbi:MAG: sigma-70 family RNA polymerase sigma factor [bacterium]|nr:sigma-70 family RNA polymerase sigma factor [bacterium]